MKAVRTRPTSASAITYWPAIDGLRCVGVLAVVLSHIFTAIEPARHKQYPVNGWIGVQLFFVISGFLITGLLLKEIQKTGTVALERFWVRRLWRLYPALLSLVAASVLLRWTQGDLSKSVLEAITSVPTYCSNFAFAFERKPDGTPLLPVELTQTWSLAVEEQFYLLWPAVLWALALCGRLKRTPVLIVTVAVLAIGFRYFVWQSTHQFRIPYAVTPAPFDALMLGAGLAWVRHKGWVPPKWISLIGTASLVCLGILVFPSRLAPGWISQVGPHSIPALSYACVNALCVVIVAAALQPAGLFLFLKTRVPVAIGKVSYSLYLWHIFAFQLVVIFTPDAPFILKVGLGLLLSAVLSFASYEYIEKRFRKPPSSETKTLASPEEDEQRQLSIAVQA